MDITITMTEEQSDSVNELIINHLDFLVDEYDIDPEDPTSEMERWPDQVDEYIGLKMVSEEIKASWNNYFYLINHSKAEGKWGPRTAR